MKSIVSLVVLTLTVSALPALANIPNLAIPSAQNSGAGIPGYAGDESGPAEHPGAVSFAARHQVNALVRLQDPAKISGLRGTESGPVERAPLRSA